MTHILVCFDGTGNEPADADQTSKDGVLEDDNISNVLKIHLLAGGRLDNNAGTVANQHSLYYSGIGTRGSIFRRVVRRAFEGAATREKASRRPSPSRLNASTVKTIMRPGGTAMNGCW